MHHLAVFASAFTVSVAIFGQVPSIPLPGAEHHKMPLPAPGDTYVLETRAEDMEVVSAAARAWARAVPVRFIYKFGDCAGILPHRICVHYMSEAMFKEIAAENHYEASWVGATQPFPSSDGSEVFVNRDSHSPEQVVRHELGHAMGLEHDMALPNVMFPLISPLSEDITCRDIAQWYRIRKRTVPKGCQGDNRSMGSGK